MDSSGGCAGEIELCDKWPGDTSYLTFGHEFVARFGEDVRVNALVLGTSVRNLLFEDSGCGDDVGTEDIEDSALGKQIPVVAGGHGVGL